jgi:hypothetical protein
MAYVDETAVLAFNKFPKPPEPSQVALWCAQRSGEVDVHLARKRVIVPVAEPPDPEETPGRAAFYAQLQLIVLYGVAAMIEGVSTPGRAPDRQAAIINNYLDEYKRLLADLDTLTELDLATMGVPLLGAATAPGVTPPGLRVSQPRKRCRTPAWYNTGDVHRASRR